MRDGLDVVICSMVTTPTHDVLSYVIPQDIKAACDNIEEALRAQRLPTSSHSRGQAFLRLSNGFCDNTSLDMPARGAVNWTAEPSGRAAATYGDNGYIETPWLTPLVLSPATLLRNTARCPVCQHG